MNPKPRSATGRRATRALTWIFGAAGGDRSERAIVGVVYLACILLVALLGPGGPLAAGAIPGGFEAGKVADRDLVATRDLVYVDEAATALRVEAERRLVPAVFVVDEKIANAALAELERFGAYIRGAAGVGDNASRELALQRDWPGVLERDAARALLALKDSAPVLDLAKTALSELFARGLLDIPDAGLEDYNPDVYEVRRWRDGRLAYERLSVTRAPVPRRAAALADEILRAKGLPSGQRELAAAVAARFAVANAPLDAEQSGRRLDAASAQVEPVIRRVERGEYLVRRGFVVSDADLARIRAARASVRRFDVGRALGGALLLAFALVFGIRSAAPAFSGLRFGKPAFLLVIGLGLGLFLLAQAVARLAPLGPGLPAQAFLPIALASMLVAILVSARYALSFAVSAAVLVASALGLEPRVLVASLVAGIGGVFAARDADKRIDLVRAGAILALIQAAASAAADLLGGAGVGELLQAAFWSGLNGFFCAILAIGFLPLLEQALNAPTRFRLMELSDLNAPPLKRLLTVAPGTYAHSVTVAHLAETACREIGANALLARVGAYYHDIGKMDQPEYFIENQAGGRNKHDEINPRLSVTVIRAHVKLGVERARALGLPREVVDIVAQHHGSGLIAWFFDKAKRKDAEAVPEDYSYPGQPPSSREAAVVMLADATEAASRSLKRPTMARLEDLVRTLAMERVRDGQLARSDLTFRDLETIIASFVRILAGHFHSRIEYPKIRENAR